MQHPGLVKTSQAGTTARDDSGQKRDWDPPQQDDDHGIPMICSIADTTAVLQSSESDSHRLIDWCREKGAFISPKITVGYPSAGDKIRGLVVMQDCEIEQGEQIMDMSICFSASSAKKESKLGLSRGYEHFAKQCNDAIAPRSILNVFLVLSRRHPSRSSAELYVHTLPDKAPDLPIFWAPEEINSLPKSIVNNLTIRLIEAERQYPLCNRLLQLCSDDGSEPPLSHAEYEWAYCNINTRSHSRQLVDLSPEEIQAMKNADSQGFVGHEEIELMPVTDMVNYQSASAGTKVSNSTASVIMGSVGRSCIWLASRRLSAGDEITWEYSKKMTTPKLLIGYGFLPDLSLSMQAGDWTIMSRIDGAIRDELELVSRHYGGGLTERKRAILEAMGILNPMGSEAPMVRMVELAAGKEPSPMMSVARILHAVEESEMRAAESAWAAKGAAALEECPMHNVVGFLSAGNEARAKDFLVHFLKMNREIDLNLGRRPERVKEDLAWLTQLYNSNRPCGQADREVPSDAVRLRRRRLIKTIYQHAADAYRQAIEQCGGKL